MDCREALNRTVKTSILSLPVTLGNFCFVTIDVSEMQGAASAPHDVQDFFFQLSTSIEGLLRVYRLANVSQLSGDDGIYPT